MHAAGHVTNARAGIRLRAVRFRHEFHAPGALPFLRLILSSHTIALRIFEADTKRFRPHKGLRCLLPYTDPNRRISPLATMIEITPQPAEFLESIRVTGR